MNSVLFCQFVILRTAIREPVFFVSLFNYQYTGFGAVLLAEFSKIPAYFSSNPAWQV